MIVLRGNKEGLNGGEGGLNRGRGRIGLTVAEGAENFGKKLNQDQQW